MKKNTITVHPEWVAKYKKPGTELRFINGRYYLYEYKTVYDPARKGPRKISGKLLGSITRKQGFIPSQKRHLENSVNQKVFDNVVDKEYGVSFLVTEKLNLYSKILQKTFGDLWTSIIAIAYCRFIYHCPLKHIPFRLEQSYLPQILGLKVFNEKKASLILKTLGESHSKRLAYMKSFIKKGEYLLMDMTNIYSNSKNISLSKRGYNNALNFDPQFNLMYIYSANSHIPVYYRLLPGNVREVKAFKNTLAEAGLKKAILIADKGFYSTVNIDLLKSENLQFILPLKRDNQLISYQSLINNTFQQSDNFFEHEKRPIWYQKSITDGLVLYLFYDSELMVDEQKDYLRRTKTHPECYTIEEYHIKRNSFGTIALLSNIPKIDAVDIYESYKSRNTIEVLFDGMKNVLEADHTYMQDEQTLQGWMFINHIVLQWYQQLYIELKEKNLLKKISVNDYIQLLTDVKKIRINDSWVSNEVTTQTQKLIRQTGILLQ